MNVGDWGMYSVMRALIGLALGFYFRRIERFHAERVPSRGPVLFTSNHPNSLADSFMLGASVSRKVNFVATVQLFRFKPLKWFLTQCGVIPINRVRDDPKAMRTVADTFEACYRVLERGEAVGIFPEGITYNDSQLKEIKSGAARMALELEHRHEGKLGLQIVPVGLTLSAKEVYRSEALVHFGEPIRAADYLEGYTDHRKECVNRLTAEIERRIQSLILHLPHLEQERVIDAVRRLYLDPLRFQMLEKSTASRALEKLRYDRPAKADAQELLLMQRAVAAVNHVFETDPYRAQAFAAKLDLYERGLKRLQVTDQDLARLGNKGRLLGKNIAWAFVAIIGLPLAVYGWIHRALPHALVKWAVRHFTEPGKRKAQTATAAIEAGIIAFGLCYTAFVWLFYRWFGWPAALWYALSLPPCSLLAHYYLREMRQLASGVQNTILLLRAPGIVRRLGRLRAELIANIAAVHEQVSRA